MQALQSVVETAIAGRYNGDSQPAISFTSRRKPAKEPGVARSSMLAVCQISELPPALMGMTRIEQDVLRILVGYHNPGQHGDVVFPGPARIGEDIGCGQRTVETVLPVLQRAGYIKTEQGRPGRSGARCSQHTLQWHAIWAAIDGAKRLRKEQIQARRLGNETAKIAASDELSTGETANIAVVRPQKLRTIRPSNKTYLKPSVLSDSVPGLRGEAPDKTESKTNLKPKENRPPCQTERPEGLVNGKTCIQPCPDGVQPGHWRKMPAWQRHAINARGAPDLASAV